MSRKFCRDPHVLERRSGPRWVLLPSLPHEPLLLDGPAATIWELLHHCRTREELTSALRDSYANTPASLDAEVGEVLARLQAQGVLAQREERM